MGRRDKSFMRSRHKAKIPMHFLKRLHERFGIGAGPALTNAIVEAIAANDGSKAVFIRDEPLTARGQELRQQWLINVAGSDVIAIYGTKYRLVYTCMRATASLDAMRTRDRVKASGGLQPFWIGVTKVPAGRAIANE